METMNCLAGRQSTLRSPSSQPGQFSTAVISTSMQLIVHDFCRRFGRSTSAWCQLGNGLRIANGGSGQWRWLRSRMGHMLLMMISNQST